MDNVVELQTCEGQPAPARGAAPAQVASTALVLGGGGFTGGVYEIGALRALDLLSVNRSVNDFDVYVGTSAGSLIAALTANGVTPEQMMRVVNDQAPPRRSADVDLDVLLRPNLREFATRGARAAAAPAAASLRAAGAQPAQLLAWSTSRSRWPTRCPPASTPAPGSRSTCAPCSRTPGRTDDFRELRLELYLAATDLDTCERIVLGAEGWDDVPISAAVRASTALPMVYEPHTLKGRELVDGGIVSTTNLDIAVEAGARLIVVVNPLVPFVNDFSKEIRTPLRLAPAPGLGHGLPEDRLPDLQAAGLPAAARGGAPVARSATRASTSCSSSPSPTTS